MGARAASSWPIRRGLREPPPETISWEIFVWGKTKRLRASTTLKAVKIVAVRMRSSGRALSLRPSLRISWTNVRPKYSRPVDFGGLRQRYGSTRSFSSRGTRDSPREAMRAPASKRLRPLEKWATRGLLGLLAEPGWDARGRSVIEGGGSRGTLGFLQVAMAASAKSSARRKLRWLISAGGMGVPSATRRMAARIGLGMGREAWPSSLEFSFGGAPLMRTRAASMPSAEVPDIRPRTRREFLGMRSL